MANLANLNMQIWSTDMSEAERKTWKTEEDICPACQDKFGGYKQVRTGKKNVQKFVSSAWHHCP